MAVENTTRHSTCQETSCSGGNEIIRFFDLASIISAICRVVLSIKLSGKFLSFYQEIFVF